MKRGWQKLKNVFNVRKTKDKRKRLDKKRKLTTSGALVVGLLFERLKTDSNKI